MSIIVIIIIKKGAREGTGFYFYFGELKLVSILFFLRFYFFGVVIFNPGLT